MKALSIRQPWCHHILNNGKDVENRTWKTSFRGQVLIHASKGVDRDDKEEVRKQNMHLGGIVGVMDIVDCVTDMSSDWFFGPHGFVLKNARPLPFIPCKGSLGFFVPELTSEENEIIQSILTSEKGGTA